ncbi:DUF402 domain-containing protein [Streptosporangium sp. NPDC001681]|uniref:DUF402 domain-containing protein n=1 Tax=Streptosporangium sp. NPDC001681 TaxID=3154395 RepID=UPI00331901BF
MTVPIAARLPVGATAIRRDIFDGRVWTASPHRVVHDTGHELALAYWPGIRSLAPTTWISWSQSEDATARDAAITNLAARQWELGYWTWCESIWLSILTEHDFFSVNLFYTPDHRLNRWYINFQRPYQRTANGVDTFDLFLDLVVAPDLSSHAWKDEDEYRHARRMGVITDDEHHQVQEARDEVLTMIQDRRGAFGADWSNWRADTSWPIPVLSPDVLTAEGVVSTI